MQQRQGPDQVGNGLLLKLAQAQQGVLADSCQQTLWRRVSKGGIRYHGQCECLQPRHVVAVKGEDQQTYAWLCYRSTSTKQC